MRQLNEVYEYIDRYNQTQATFDKLLRIDTRDYPEAAVREALLNLFVHRDYALSASALISIYSDRMEFVSAGGLLPEIELEDVMMGLSVCRNQNLANVFYRLRLIEAYGTGIRKIMKAYEHTSRKPVIETTKNVFKVTLPNIHVWGVAGVDRETESAPAGERDEAIVLECVAEEGFVTRSELEEVLGISASTASRLLRRMTEKRLLVPWGKGRGVRYVLGPEGSV